MTPEQIQEATKSLHEINQVLLQQAMLDYPDHEFTSVKMKYDLEVSSIASLIEPINKALQRLEKAEKLAEALLGVVGWEQVIRDLHQRESRPYLNVALEAAEQALAEWEA